MKAKLTIRTVQGLQPGEKPFEVFDTEIKGFLLRVEPTGSMTYYLAYNLDGKRRRFKIGRASDALKPEQARDIAKVKAGLVANGEDPQEQRLQKRKEHATAKVKTLGGFIEHKYQPWVLAERKDANATLKRLEACFAFLNGRPLKEITAWDIQKWRAEQQKAGKAKTTLNRDVTALRAVLSKAIEWGDLEHHPLRKLKQIKVDDDSRVRYLTTEEEKRLLTALNQREEKIRAGRTSGNEWRKQRGLPPLPEIPADGFADHLKPIVLLALNTGLRRGELFHLTWGKVNLMLKSVTVEGEKAKSGKTRHVPLNSTALATLNRWQKQTGSDGLVFPGQDKDGKEQPLSNIQTAWENVVLAAKLENFHFHDLRHDFASKLVMAGVDLNTVRELLGHKDMKMTLRYAHLAPEHKAAAVEHLASGGEA